MNRRIQYKSWDIWPDKHRHTGKGDEWTCWRLADVYVVDGIEIHSYALTFLLCDEAKP